MAILNSESVHTPTLLNQMHLKKFPEHQVYDSCITQQFSGKSRNIILTSKRRGKHVSNKNIRYKKEDWKEEVALSPFLHSKQWFHQDKSLKSVITLIFFLIRRPELVGKGTVWETSLSRARKGSSFNTFTIIYSHLLL